MRYQLELDEISIFTDYDVLGELPHPGLNEADRMLDQEIEHDVRSIIAKTHPQIQTYLQRDVAGRYSCTGPQCKTWRINTSKCNVCDQVP